MRILKYISQSKFILYEKLNTVKFSYSQTYSKDSPKLNASHCIDIYSTIIFFVFLFCK